MLITDIIIIKSAGKNVGQRGEEGENWNLLLRQLRFEAIAVAKTKLA